MAARKAVSEFGIEHPVSISVYYCVSGFVRVGIYFRLTICANFCFIYFYLYLMVLNT